jgi:hypothetical protein
LDDLPSFKNRIYPADRFFKAMDALPPEDLRGVIPEPEKLMVPSGRITRVGISDEAVSGFIELGFEIQEGTERRVILTKGHEWAVWLLRSYLEKGSLEMHQKTETGTHS